MLPNARPDTATFDETAARASDALLLLAPGRLFLGAYDSSNAVPLLDESFPRGGGEADEFRNRYFEHDLFSLPFRSLALLADRGEVYSLAPKELLADESLYDLWLPGLGAGERVLKEEPEDQEFGVLFPVHEELKAFAERSFGRFRFAHPVTGLLQAALLASRKSSRGCLYGCLSGSGTGEILDLVHASEGRVLFANRFRLHGEADALYYITAVWRSEGLDQASDELRLFADEPEERFLSTPASLKDAVRRYGVNEYGAIGKERPGAEAFPAALRLRMLCA